LQENPNSLIQTLKDLMEALSATQASEKTRMAELARRIAVAANDLHLLCTANASESSLSRTKPILPLPSFFVPDPNRDSICSNCSEGGQENDTEQEISNEACY
jgi:hypothetical protein